MSDWTKTNRMKYYEDKSKVSALTLKKMSIEEHRMGKNLLHSINVKQRVLNGQQIHYEQTVEWLPRKLM